MKCLIPALLALMAALVSMPASADSDRDQDGYGRKSERRMHQDGEYKEEFQDGNCKVKRKWERNGEFEEEVECKGSRGPVPRHARDGDYEEEFQDGNCKVKRKWERDGDFKEKVKCKGPRGPAPRYEPAPRHEHGGAGVTVTPPSVVIQPPAVIIQPPSVIIDGGAIRVR